MGVILFLGEKCIDMCKSRRIC